MAVMCSGFEFTAQGHQRRAASICWWDRDQNTVGVVWQDHDGKLQGEVVHAAFLRAADPAGKDVNVADALGKAAEMTWGHTDESGKMPQVKKVQAILPENKAEGTQGQAGTVGPSFMYATLKGCGLTPPQAECIMSTIDNLVSLNTLQPRKDRYDGPREEVSDSPDSAGDVPHSQTPAAIALQVGAVGQAAVGDTGG